MRNSKIRLQPLKILLLIHGLITLAAGIVLIANPPLIPETVSIDINPQQYLLCYMLGAAELSIGFLSIFASKLKEGVWTSLRLISLSFILFHLMTGALEIWAYKNGADSKILINLLARILISILFGYYGVYRIKSREENE